MRRIMPWTLDARDILDWLEERLGNGLTVRVEQPGAGFPVEWTPQRWAHLVDILHVPSCRTRAGELLMLITTEGWDGSPEYVVVDIRERLVYVERVGEHHESREGQRVDDGRELTPSVKGIWPPTSVAPRRMVGVGPPPNC